MLQRSAKCIICDDRVLGYIKCDKCAVSYCRLCHDLLYRCEKCACVHCHECGNTVLFTRKCGHFSCPGDITNDCSRCAGLTEAGIIISHMTCVEPITDINKMRDCRYISKSRLTGIYSNKYNPEVYSVVEFYSAGFLSTGIIAYCVDTLQWFSNTNNLWVPIVLPRKIAKCIAARDMLFIAGIDHIWDILRLFAIYIPIDVLYTIAYILTKITLMPETTPRPNTSFM